MLTGCIVGIVDVVDCVEWHDSDWFNGPFGWVLANPRVLKPCPCKGKLGLFEFDYPYLLEETDPIPLLFEISG